MRIVECAGDEKREPEVELLFEKPINKSLFDAGFVIPINCYDAVSRHLKLGRLNHGEKRAVRVFFNGKLHDASLQSSDFKRDRNPTHGDQWRILHRAGSTLRRSLNDAFTPTGVFALYSTGISDIFYLELRGTTQ